MNPRGGEMQMEAERRRDVRLMAICVVVSGRWRGQLWGRPHARRRGENAIHGSEVLCGSRSVLCR